MSGALGEDTVRTIASGRETVGGVLSAAQSHLKKVFFVFVVGMMLTIWALRAFIWDRLKEDLVFARMDVTTQQATEIIAVTPFDVILLQVKIGLIVGIIVALPVMVWYGRDALKRRGFWPDDSVPAWKIWGVVFTVGLLFVGGVSYAYFAFFPIMFNFLAANAVQSGFEPTYSIVMWTQFMFFLALSFGIAAQLPLAMSALARSNIVPYETFRDKWRYAVVGIFVFGAMFSPPDPFTQVMWGVPLVGLYVFSLGVTKLAVLSKRAGAQVSSRAVARARWNLLGGTFLVAGAAVYVYLLEGGLELSNDALIALGSDYRVPAVADLAVFGQSPETVATAIAAVAALLITAIALFYLRIQELEKIDDPDRQSDIAEVTPEEADETDVDETDETDDEGDEPPPGEPAEIDIGGMHRRAIEAAPVEAFTDLSEERALHYAQQAIDEDNAEKAEAILDRFDEAEEYQQELAEDEGDEGNVVTQTTAGIVDSFTEDETDEDDIGGYYYDIAFILESLTSKAIWVVAVFMIVLAGSFMFLYTGGIRTITELFLGSLPQDAVDEVVIVTLHPVEALLFMLKFSTLLAALSIVPILLYFAWPAIEERGISTGNRNVLLVWGGTLFVTLLFGSLLGFLYIAPAVISWLAWDVISSSMVIAYRINNFGWLVIYLTVGIGVLAMIPMTMLLFHQGNIIEYDLMVDRWRGVILAFFAAAAFLSPGGIFTMFLVAIPVSLAYLVGVAVLWVYTRIEFVVFRRGQPAE